MAPRVEFGELQDAGVARSSRAGMKRTVNARPTFRSEAEHNGRAPRIQTLRSPFFNSTVVKVAVVTFARALKDCSSLIMVVSSDGVLDAWNEAAIDPDGRARHVAGPLAGEESHHIGIFVRGAIAPQRNACGALRFDRLDIAPFALGARFVKEPRAVRTDAARNDHIRGDAILGHVPSQGLGPPQQRGTRDIGKRKIRNGRNHPRRGAGDDPAPAALTHARKQEIRDADYRDHHGFERRAPVLRRLPERRPRLRATRVVDQNVDAPDIGQDFLHPLTALLTLAQIPHVGPYLASYRLDAFSRGG